MQQPRKNRAKENKSKIGVKQKMYSFLFSKKPLNQHHQRLVGWCDK